MPKFDITAPDGTQYTVEGPEGSTEQQALEQVMKAHGSAPMGAAPKGGANDVIDYANGIADWPNRLMGSAAELVARGTDAAGISDGAYDMLHNMRTSSPGSKYSKAGAIVGDIGATLPLNGIRMARALPQIANAGRFVKGAARIGDAALQGGAATLATSSSNDAPLGEQLALGAGLSAAVPTLGMVARGGKNLVRGVIGETTGAGGQSIANAYAAGRAGGDASKAFTESMRGNGGWDQVVKDAQTALGNLKAQRSEAYHAGMADISKDKSVLDFAPIDEAISNASTVKNFKGRDLSKSTAEVRKEISDTIAEWKAFDPAEYHTPEGFDAMKQELKDILDKQDPTKPAYLVAKSAYDAVRNTIAKQAPAYDKVMKDYSEASDEIDSILKEFSLNKKANPNTALRKLQSVMRDNANTSWGQRASMADRLSEAGAPNLLPQLAGQSLSSPIPRGLAKYGDLALAIAKPSLLLGAPFASPRVVGEVAHGAGALNRNVRSVFDFLPPVPFSAAQLSPAIGATAPSLFGR